MYIRLLCIMLLLSAWPALSYAEEGEVLNLTDTQRGIYSVLIFLIAYGFVMTEEFTQLRKSQPVILAAGIIWGQVAYMASSHGVSMEELYRVFRSNLTEYAGLMLFIMVAMTYINVMAERGVFDAIRVYLVKRRFDYRQLFWITGIITLFLSSVADNLTSALLVGAVVMAVGSHSPRFVALSFINLVSAANAGGAFSPFGDITTLMVWQGGKAEFFDFYMLLIPSFVNFAVPAVFMHFAIPHELPAHSEEDERIELKTGALPICGLFFLTLVTAVCFKQFLQLPPFLGMMVGLGYLMFYGYRINWVSDGTEGEFDIFDQIKECEWDTLFFFFGVVFAIGGLGYIGYLQLLSAGLYEGLGPTAANIFIGLLSSVVDNIPVMYAVLKMDPAMDIYQWMLVTLTTGVGGSMLSIGSAAGVALMGTSRGMYTFVSHLKWTPAIIAGYAGSILCHYWLNG